MFSTTYVTMGQQGTTRATRCTLQERPALCAPRILSVQTACCVVNIHFVLEFEYAGVQIESLCALIMMNFGSLGLKTTAITGTVEGRERQWVWHVVCIGETRFTHVILAGNFLGAWRDTG